LTSFALRRLASAVPTLLGVVVAAFLILNLLPSDPVLNWFPEGAAPSAEALERLRHALRSEEVPLARFASWGAALLRGDLGRSLVDGRPVGSVVAEALPWTLLLNLCALLAIYGLAVPFGVCGAASPGSIADRVGGWVLLLLYALPSFAAAVLLQEAFAVRLEILPLQGVAGLDAGAGLASRGLDLVRHLVLPTACLALSGWSFVARYTRSTFRSVLGREFLSVARAKGMSRPRAWRHVLANTAVPFVTLLGGIIPALVGGSLIVEHAFSWPGLGRLYVASVEGRDYPVVLGLTLLAALLVLGANLLVDLLYLAVDPRIRDAFLGERGDA